MYISKEFLSCKTKFSNERGYMQLTLGQQIGDCSVETGMSEKRGRKTDKLTDSAEKRHKKRLTLN